MIQLTMQRVSSLLGLLASQPLSKLSGIINDEFECREERVKVALAWERFTLLKSIFALPNNGSKGKENTALLP